MMFFSSNEQQVGGFSGMESLFSSTNKTGHHDICENGFLRAISHRKGSLRYKMWWEVHFKQSTLYVCQGFVSTLYVCQGFVSTLYVCQGFVSTLYVCQGFVSTLYVCQGQNDVNIMSC
jgi:hypothetical protein